jgi:hypothetical protein
VSFDTLYEAAHATNIHYLQSPDGGQAWRTMSGMPVSLRVIADEGGPADRISLDDEFAVTGMRFFAENIL